MEDHRLINLKGFILRIHIVFLLSKPLNQVSCLKSKKILDTTYPQEQLHTSLLVYDKSS